ncbi:FeoA family protein [Aurantiacibacter aquimixticola]|uniref:Ferrous iron transport protein A n=1 Tax=Aurantiacibacter aquimixticola TaxID=1958945 RepID=A0A419RVR6_9SPHN|nr:FeoA family protein [Aurantiacibacter aquimixticola]RJY09886.1 ferrous iron transport protein A [Aurantiacibacter aquimixticola]
MTQHSETLDTLPPLARAEIVSVDWQSLAPDEGKRLRALGLDEGARIAVAHRGVFFGKDPIALMVGRTTIAVRRAHARAMRVRQL